MTLAFKYSFSCRSASSEASSRPWEDGSLAPRLRKASSSFSARKRARPRSTTLAFKYSFSCRSAALASSEATSRKRRMVALAYASSVSIRSMLFC